MRIKHSAFAAASVALAVLALITPALAAQANGKPCLCRPTITPLDGTSRTVFVATVNYEDPDGDLPAKVEVYIDGTAYPMRLVKGQAARGLYRARLTLPPGEHNYYFYAEDARGANERFPRYGAKPGPYVGTGKKLLNRLPLLNEGGVYFDYGTDKNVYTYTVKYEDRDKCKPPRVVKAIVDGIPHEMKLHKGTANDGIYLYQTSLKPGPHAYYFVALDGDGDCVTHPALGFLRGPDVAGARNEAPLLLDPKLDPQIGTNVTKFNYSVFYRDDDGDPAALALIYVDGVPYKMTRTAGTAANGIYTYRCRDFRTTMHDYYFYFEDGRGGTRRVPEIGAFHGPVVMK
jgi:hypothetical protein